MGITTNNIAELGTVQQGLILAWNLGIKFVHLEMDFMLILNWSTTEIFHLMFFPLFLTAGVL